MLPTEVRSRHTDRLPRVHAGVVLVPSQTLDVVAHADVIVAGGGVAGCMAAVAAARAGAKTLLVEANSFLGGTATGGMMGALVFTDQAAGLASELIGRLAAAGGAPEWTVVPGRSRTTPFDLETYKHVALQMAQEAGVVPLFSTVVLGPIMDGPGVRGIEIHNKSGRAALTAANVVDCTGDADLAAASGAPFYKGREDDHRMRPFSLLFRIGGLDLRRMYDWGQAHPDQLQPSHRSGTLLRVGGEHVITRISGFFELVEEAKRRGEMIADLHYFRLEDCWIERGLAICNTTRIYEVDGTNAQDLSRAQVAALEQVRMLVQFARKYIPGCENAFVVDVAPTLGIRETRRIIGRYFLTDADMFGDRTFDDAILTFGGMLPTPGPTARLDVHMPEAIEGSEKDTIERNPDGAPHAYHRFQVPYRCLLPRDTEHLLVAGRSISVSHRIDVMTRNQVVAMRMGQVAGTAAAVGALQGIPPHALPFAAVLKPALVAGGLSDLEVAHTPGYHLAANREGWARSS